MSIYFVFALALFSISSSWASRVVLPLYALELGARPLTVGILAATFSVLPMLLTVPAGKLADRVSSHWPLTLIAAASALCTLLPYFFPGLPAIFMAAAIGGLATGIFDVSLQNLAGLLSTPQNRARVFSNYALITASSNLFGPLIAGISIDLIGHASACVLIAALIAIPAVLLVFRGGPLPTAARENVREKSDLRSMLAETGFSRMMITTSLLTTGRDLFRFYMPVYAHAIGLSASTIGIVLAMCAGAEFTVRIVLPRLIARFKEEGVLAGAFFVGAVAFTLIPFFQDPAMLALVAFLFGLGMGCGQPIITILMFSNAPAGRSGTALGLRMAAIHITRLVGPVTFGAVATVIGVPPLFWVNAVMLGAGGMVSRAQHSANNKPD